VSQGVGPEFKPQYCKKKKKKKERKRKCAGWRWLTPVILATQQAKIRRIMVQSQPGEGPEFKPQYRREKKKEIKKKDTVSIWRVVSVDMHSLKIHV
jgi:hypothetical protein